MLKSTYYGWTFAHLFHMSTTALLFWTPDYVKKQEQVAYG